MAAEQWKAVIGYEGIYQVSDAGRVWSVPRVANGRQYGGHYLIPYPAPSKGYLMVGLCAPGKQHTVKVHQIVLRAFVGERPDGFVTRHLNGNQTDNRLTNLVYGTQAENSRDTIRHGRNPHLNKTHCAKGHAYSPENTYVAPTSGWRDCRECKRNRQHEWHIRNRKTSSRLAVAA